MRQISEQNSSWSVWMQKTLDISCRSRGGAARPADIHIQRGTRYNGSLSIISCYLDELLHRWLQATSKEALTPLHTHTRIRGFPRAL